MRDIAGRFEHRLFLSATPHNGHANSFATLLEILDPQRFTRGMEVRVGDLEPVMIRRLKEDLRKLGEAFPKREVAPVRIAGLPEDAPELKLAEMLSIYGTLRERRIGALRATKAAQARLSFVGLQQRLLSSVPAFAKTLRVHRKSLLRVIELGAIPTSAATAAAHVAPELSDFDLGDGGDEDAALVQLEADEDESAAAAATIGAEEATRSQLDAELAAVDAMMAIAEPAAQRADARIAWLQEWIGDNLLAGGQWTGRRLLIFTEYEATRRYIQSQLESLLADTADPERRIATFTGITSSERREAIKRAFNDADHPLRILICTDAAREGINLQQQCHDLIHFDLPWNPSRLEQRNGRIDRKLQPAPEVFCRYFLYEQRPEDIVLDALVRKTELIHRQLGSAGQVIENRIARRMTDRGIRRADAASLAAAIDSEEADEAVAVAVKALGDQPDSRLARIEGELGELKAALETARARVGVDAHELEAVVGLALERAGADMNSVRGAPVRDTSTFALSADLPGLAEDPSWQPVFDDLRARRQKRGERPGQWRDADDAQVQRIAFAPAIDEAGRDEPGVIQVHVEHRLVKRLLSRFLTAGFQAGLNRACVIRTNGAADRAVLLGRLALYGPGAMRLHEEIIPIAAAWYGGSGRAPLQALAASDEAGAAVIAELESALGGAGPASDATAARFTATISADVADLRLALEAQAFARRGEVEKELAQRGREEAQSLRALLKSQIDRIRAERGKDDRQGELDLEENRQREADRRSWEAKLERLTEQLEDEPKRLRDGFEVRAYRIEPIGMVYLAGRED